jgi:DNA topoisomerase-1
MPYVKHGRSYVDERTGKAASSSTLEKIRAVYVPPGYTDVRFLINSKLLATGVDSKGRTQYIYSNEHKRARTNKRKDTVLKVSKVISQIEAFIRGNIRSCECAVILSLIQNCNFRIGNDQNVKKYKHYGLTTLTSKHFQFGPRSCKIDFVGKKGVQNTSVVRCPKTVKSLKELARANKRDAKIFTVSAADVNDCLRPYDVTTKDLRTYNANITFIQNYQKHKDAKLALEKTSECFHNTKTVLKNSYIVPDVFEACKNDLLPTSSKDTKRVLLHILK